MGLPGDCLSCLNHYESVFLLTATRVVRIFGGPNVNWDAQHWLVAAVVAVDLQVERREGADRVRNNIGISVEYSQWVQNTSWVPAHRGWGRCLQVKPRLPAWSPTQC